MHSIVNKQPLRVCFLIDQLARAGTETQLVALIRNLDRSKVQPYLVLLDGNQPISRMLEPDCCPILRLGLRSFRYPNVLYQCLRFAAFLSNNRIDVLQTYFVDSSFFGLLIAWFIRIRHRLQVRNNLGHNLNNWQRLSLRFLSLFATKTIVNCAAAQRHFIKTCLPLNPGKISDRIVVIENGVDLDRFISIPTKNNSGHYNNICTVGSIANLRPVKGLNFLVEAIGQLIPRIPGIKLQIAGEGEQRYQLLDHAALYAVPLKLPGSVDDIPNFLSEIDVYVHVSLSEGMPNAVLEAMAAGRPIVATCVGGVPELIQHERTGLIVPPGDVNALAHAISRMIHDRDLANRLGNAAREFVLTRFSRKAMIRRFEEFYQKLN